MSNLLYFCGYDKKQQKYHVFSQPKKHGQPTQYTHGDKYSHVFGPFRTKHAALLSQAAGIGGYVCVADAERHAKTIREKQKMEQKMTKCDSCQVAYINGIRTHEEGCPGEWKQGRECKECGQEFKPEMKTQVICNSCFEEEEMGEALSLMANLV